MPVERYAEHPADDGDRVRLGVVVEELHLAGLRERQEQVTGQLASRLPQSLDAARCERRRDQLADARVIRRLEPEQAPALRRPEGLPARVERRNADLLRAHHVPKVPTQAFVTQATADVLVAGHEPPLAPLVVEDGRGLPEPAQGRVGILEEARIRGIEGRRLPQSHGPNHRPPTSVLGESGGGRQ